MVRTRWFMGIISLVCALLCLRLPVASAQAEVPGQLRVANFAGDNGNVDVYLDGTLLAADFAAGGATDFVPVTSERHEIAFTLTGAPISQPLFVPVQFDASADHLYSVVLTGQTAVGSLTGLVLDETELMADSDMSRSVFRIIVNNLPGVPELSFYEADMWVEQNIPYGGYSASAFTPFTWDTGKAVAGSDLDDIVFDFDSDVDQSAGFWEPYTVYLYGVFGTYPGAMYEDYRIEGAHQYVVAPDIPSFLAAFTPYELTLDFNHYFTFETAVTAMQATDFMSALPDEPVTIFVPTDSAFAELPEASLNTLLADPAQLSALLLNHVVMGSLTYDDLVSAETLTTLNGGTLQVSPSVDDGFTFQLNDQTTVVNFDYPFIHLDNTRVYFITSSPLLP